MRRASVCAAVPEAGLCVLQDDAQIGVDVLGWKQTITGVGHCRQVGCPESGITDAVQRLASLGYKVPSQLANLQVAVHKPYSASLVPLA